MIGSIDCLARLRLRPTRRVYSAIIYSAIRWVQRFREDGICEPMPRGGSTSPLEKYSQQILALIREQRDLTLNEIVSVLHRRRIPGSRSALSRFFRSPWHHL